MSAQTRKILVLLLLLLQETGRTAGCADRCTEQYGCPCSGLGFTSVPQFLPTDVTKLYLASNAITTLDQSDFSRYSSLSKLDLESNRISTINSGAFYNLTKLTALHLAHNLLTSLRADMFAGLDCLGHLDLGYNNIQTIEEGTFNNTSQLDTLLFSENEISALPADMYGLNMSRLQTLDLSFNRINAFPVEGLNISVLSSLKMQGNRMETLQPTAYDILASLSFVSIAQNPWQCDCRMLPFRQRMTGFYTFEYTITCAGPAHMQGKSLLQEVNPQDLTCEETVVTTTGPPSVVHPGTLNTPTAAASSSKTPPHTSPKTPLHTGTVHFQPGRTEGNSGASPAEFPTQVFLSGFLPGVIVGAVLASAAFFSVWYYRRRRAGSVPEHSAVFSNVDTTATVTAGGKAY